MDRHLTELPKDLLQPHLILPAQHFNRPPKFAPEHRLMMAVLDDAVRCIENYRFAADTRRRRLFREAKQWLLAARSNWPYSFERICAVLDLDPGAVRQRLELEPERALLSVSTEVLAMTAECGDAGSATSNSATGLEPISEKRDWRRTQRSRQKEIDHGHQT